MCMYTLKISIIISIIKNNWLDSSGGSISGYTCI